MIKIEVSNDKIIILGHAMFDDYGKDIVCAAVSSVVITTVEGIARIDETAIDIKQNKNLTIIINKHDIIIDKLIDNMLNLLKELENKYPKNIKITNKEE